MTITGSGSVNDGSSFKSNVFVINQGADFENNCTNTSGAQILSQFKNEGTLTGSGTLKLGESGNSIVAYNSGRIEQSGINLSNGTFENTASGTIILSGQLQLGASGASELTNNGVIETSKLTVEDNSKIFGSFDSVSSTYSTGTGELKFGGVSKNKGLIYQHSIISTGAFENQMTVVADILEAETLDNSKAASQLTVGSLLAQTITNKGSFTVNKNAELNSLTNELTFGAGTLTASIINNSQAASQLTVSQDASILNLTNAGTVDVQGQLTSTDPISGSALITNGGTLTTQSLVANKIDNTGNVNVLGNANIVNLVNNANFNLGNTVSQSRLTVLGDIDGTSGVLNAQNTVFTPLSVVKNQTINLSDNSILNINNPYNFINNSLDINDSTVNINSITLTPVWFNDLGMTNGTINISSIDLDLGNRDMGRIVADNYNLASGTVNIKGLNISNYNHITNADKIEVMFTDEASLAQNVHYSGAKSLMTPVLLYGIGYETLNNKGKFVFTPGNGSSTSNAAAFNPAVLTSPVTAQAGSYAAMTETLNNAFRHVDYTFMPWPSKVRKSIIDANKYAISEPQTMPYQYNDLTSRNIWIQPYSSFENMHLSHGPRVDVVSYGSLVGGDSEYHELENGWGTVTTAFMGYNGSNIHYSGIHTYQNGGVLGATQTFYKNNFFTALTLSTGASVGEATTMYGYENFTSLMAGIASKTGYNLEFKEGKFIIQPSLLMAYSFINTFDYTNAAGVRIDSDPLHSVQIHPTIKFIGNIKGWQPYARVGMVWNILNDTKLTANDIRLPEMSIKPYVEYGVGVQKMWQEHCSAFVQAMMRNGGRNGIALSFGIKINLGKSHVQNVNNPDKQKIVLKSR